MQGYCSSSLGATRTSINFLMFFEHCKCRYSDWTDWTIPENATFIAVPSYQCPSGMAWPEERWQKVISGYECEDEREERHLCKLGNNHACIDVTQTCKISSHINNCLCIYYVNAYHAS